MATVTNKRKPKTGKATTRKKSKTVTATAKSLAKTVQVPTVKAEVKPELATTPVGVADPVVAAPDLKKKELVDLVVERSGIKKKDAKPVVEAMLAVLGETIASGRELNLQPFGKLRINRATEKANGNVIICKLRQSKAVGKTAKEQPAAVSDH